MTLLGPDGKPIRRYPEVSEEVRQIVEQARSVAAQGEPLLALQHLAMAYQQDIASDLVIDTTIELLKQGAQQSGIQTNDELTLFEQIRQDRTNPIPYYQLGNRFFQLQRPFLARPFLDRSRQLLAALPPSAFERPELLQLRQAADVDYAQTLMDLGEYEQTLEMFHTINDTYGGLPIWLILEMAECYALLGQMEEAEATYRLITPEALSAITAQLPEMESVYEEVGDLLARVQDFEDPRALGLREWHYVQTRGILVETNPQPETPGERFVFFQPSEEDVAYVVGVTAAFLDARDLAPTKLLWLGETSEPLARLFAQWWEIEEKNIRPYQIGDNTDSEEELALLCLAHSYDIQDEDTYQDLATAKPGLILFALDLHWTERQPITPDIAGFMTQTCNLPWETRLEISSDGQTATPIQETRDPQTIAQEIGAQFPTTEECERVAEELTETYAKCTDLILDHRDGTLIRRPLPIHSPIKSPRFGL